MPRDTPFREGDFFAERYRLISLLGGGAFGQVWKALDVESKREVAIKLMRAVSARMLARIQMEVAALRLRLPGIVDLIDHGQIGEYAYLVMELVDGTKFPGCPVPCSWQSIRDATIALLETLGQIHAASYLHRDLKPENVLVTAVGQVRVLDLGFAFKLAPDEVEQLRLTTDDETPGTPAYIAPEQIRGEPIEQSDLYAVGVMLYEALSGRLPHPQDNVVALFSARLTQAPAPIRDHVPDLPSNVARAVDSLLDLDVKRRPASAAAVLSLLRGEQFGAAPFPGLGNTDAVTTAMRLAEQGRSVDFLGPRGMGRTRHLQSVAAALGASRRITWLPAGEVAFSSLTDLIDTTGYQELDLDEMTRRVTEVVKARLAAGDVLVADDCERIDRQSAAILESCRSDGVILRGLLDSRESDSNAEGSFFLRPLLERDLRDLFTGSDCLFHLREDAARFLHRRTGGVPALLVREVSSWVALGFARWDRGHLTISRETLDRMEAGLWSVDPLDTDLETLQRMRPSLLDILVWMALLEPYATVSTVVAASGMKRYQVESDLTVLFDQKLVGRTDGDSLTLRIAVAPQLIWTSKEKLANARRAVAQVLPVGTARRLLLLSLSGRESKEGRIAIGVEAAEFAKRRLDEGKPAHAAAAVDFAIRGLFDDNSTQAAECRLRLLTLAVEAAVSIGTSDAIGRTQLALQLVEPKTPELDLLLGLSQAALALDEFSGRALDIASQVPPCADGRLMRVRQNIRIHAANRSRNPTSEARVLAEIVAENGDADPEVSAAIRNSQGRIKYLQGDFEQAAHLHGLAATLAENRLTKAYSYLRQVGSLIELFEFDEAGSALQKARVELGETRHPNHEAWLIWLERTLRYRRGETELPDLELIDAVGHVGNRQTEGLVCFHEAVLAWRCRESDRAGFDVGPSVSQITDLAYNALTGIRGIPGPILLRCFRFMLGVPLAEGELLSLVELVKTQAAQGIGIQGLGLLAIGLTNAKRRFPADLVSVEDITRLVEPIPARYRALRMDILSADEAAAAAHRAL
ncbi:MAG: serine/threonine protein kinase [Polyangiaceae bacterium]|nr:serine/threonine protein kinase [Polyangiaceae bacterium]